MVESYVPKSIILNSTISSVDPIGFSSRREPLLKPFDIINLKPCPKCEQPFMGEYRCQYLANVNFALPCTREDWLKCLHHPDNVEKAKKQKKIDDSIDKMQQL